MSAQIDDDAKGVAIGVLINAVVDGIRAAGPVNGIGTYPALETVVQRVAGEVVHPRAADHVFNVTGESIGIGARGRGAAKRQGDVAVAFRVVDHVYAVATGNVVVAAAADQDVVAVAATEAVGQLTAIEGVIATAADQRVGAVIAFELVGVAVAGKYIGNVRSVYGLNASHREIETGINSTRGRNGTLIRSQRQIDGVLGNGGAVGDTGIEAERVEAGTAIEYVAAGGTRRRG